MKGSNRLSNRLSYAIAVIIILLAVGLRLWDVSTLPLGLHAEEVTNLRLMDSIRRTGNLSVYYDTGTEVLPQGREGLYPVTQAIATLFTGTGSIGYRMVGIWASILTLPLIYTLGVRLYGRVAGLLAMSIMGYNMWAVLLGHQIVVEAALLPVVTATLLALARALPVYRNVSDDNTNTTAFAALGILLGISLYVHPAGLALLLGTVLAILYTLIVSRPLSQRRISFIGFAILLAIIISVPYLLSTLRLPELAAPTRFFGIYSDGLSAILNGLGGLFIQGDLQPVTNIPGRPMFNPLIGLIALIGLVMSLRNWRAPRFGIVIIMTLILIPPATLTETSPDFYRLTLLMPSVALLFGFGGAKLIERLETTTRSLAIAGFIAFFGYLIIISGHDLYTVWPERADVRGIYYSDVAEIASYIDRTAFTTPTLLCDPNWDIPSSQQLNITRAQLIHLMMNTHADLRIADCRRALVFSNGGEREQLVFSQRNILPEMHPFLRFWLENSTVVSAPDLPDETVYIFDRPQLLANQLGLYTTIAPATFPTRIDDQPNEPIQPPIRFGGNITWMGYERTDVLRTYQPGETVPVINFWRVEGLVPVDLTLFTHILTDPVTIAANRDVIHVDPRTLEARDVFVQVTDVTLPPTILTGRYDISVGAYQSTSDSRLPAFYDGRVRDERIILYNIGVSATGQDD